jgi:hypothetical protein
MLLDSYVIGEETLMVLEIKKKIFLRLLINITREKERNENCHAFSDICWEMRLKAIGQLLGPSERI